MTNDPPADDRGAADSEAFEEWLEQAAESKGVSRQELMNQMLSSYWILDELTGLVNEAELEGGTDHRSPGPADSDPETELGGRAKPAEAPETADQSEKPETADQSEKPDEDTSTEASIREIHAAIQELVDAQSADATSQSADDDADGDLPTLDGDVVSVVSDLQRQIGTFDSKLDDVEDRQDTQFDRLSNELQLVLDRVDELERTQDRYVEQKDIDTLDAQISDLYDRVEELRTTDEALEAQNRELETRMDREFDSIEALFHRLLNALDDLDSELDAATESYRNELGPIKQRESEREDLEALKNVALNREIRRGTCESCGQRVDLGLLESPTCPSCTARFTGIEDGGWNPFRSPTLKTEPKLNDRT